MRNDLSLRKPTALVLKERLASSARAPTTRPSGSLGSMLSATGRNRRTREEGLLWHRRESSQLS